MCAQRHFFKCEFTQAHFFICEITTVIAGNFETILYASVTKIKAILDGIEFWVSKIVYEDICIKEHGL